MKRIQRKGSKGWKMPENTIYVGRPSMWGNPFNWKDYIGPGIDEAEAKKVALNQYREWMKKSLVRGIAKRRLRGKNLSCWCRLDQPCHADILLEIANE